MADELATSIERLRTSTRRLNVITDEIAKQIKQVESILEEAGVGIYARTLVKESEDGSSMFLEYDRLGQGKFRIGVCWGTLDEDCGLREHSSCAWSECSREVKLESFVKLPELLNVLAKTVEAHVGEAEKALAVVNAKLPPIQKKKGE
jgi:hypothetical protein